MSAHSTVLAVTIDSTAYLCLDNLMLACFEFVGLLLYDNLAVDNKFHPPFPIGTFNFRLKGIAPTDRKAIP
jgi:hypothetical protein